MKQSVRTLGGAAEDLGDLVERRVRAADLLEDLETFFSIADKAAKKILEVAKRN